MTKKHFKLLAEALNRVRPEVLDDETYDDERWTTWRASVDAVSDACAQVNPNFDRDKFQEACDA